MSRPSLATPRAILILLALAAAVDLLPGASGASNVLSGLLQLIFFGGLGWLGHRLYREHRIALFSLGDRARGILYGSLVLVVLGFAATARLWQSGAGIVAWLVLLGLACGGFLHVVRAARG